MMSADATVLGDAKFLTLVRGVQIPPAKFMEIAGHVWMVQGPHSAGIHARARSDFHLESRTFRIVIPRVEGRITCKPRWELLVVFRRGPLSDRSQDP